MARLTDSRDPRQYSHDATNITVRSREQETEWILKEKRDPEITTLTPVDWSLP